MPQACERLGKHQAALKDLQFALSIDPSDVQVAQRLKTMQEKVHSNGQSGGPNASPKVRSDELKDEGNVCMKAGKHREALEKYTDALALNPRNIAARNNRVVCLMELGDLEEAERDATQVRAMHPVCTLHPDCAAGGHFVR